MASQNVWDDQETWERVADGPLSPSQLSELVAACDERPELWRRCALTLLEEQTLRHELQAITRTRLVPQPRSVPSQSSEVVQASPTPLPCPGLVAPAESGLRESRPASNGLSSFWNNLALAATVMIAFGIGWQASRRVDLLRGFDGSNLTDRTMQLGKSETTGTAPSPALDSPGDTMFARSESVDPAVVDRVNAETLAKAMQVEWHENLEPEYQQLRKRGYEVESQEGLMPLWLYDGSSAVIPYQQIIVRPKSQVQEY